MITLLIASFLDFQLMAGSRATNTVPSSGADGSQFSGSEFGAAALIHPVRFVPVSVGGFALQQDFKSQTAGRDERLSGLESGLDVMAWLPIHHVQPYLRGQYDLYGSHRYAAKQNEAPIFSATGDPVPTDVEVEGGMTGYHTAFGMRFRPMPFFGAFLQYDLAHESFTPKRATFQQDGGGMTVDAKGVSKLTLQSRSVMLGIDVGT